MADDEDDQDEPTPIELEGDGPFILPLCETDVGLALGQIFALLEVTTIDGKVIQIPFGHDVLKVLHEISGQALEHLPGHEGEMLQ
jgi:hypothetical protein